MYNGSMKNTDIKSDLGAIVQFCGHNGWFIADILKMGPVTVVNANGPVTPDNLVRDHRIGAPTHHLSDFPLAGFWNTRKGVFVVPSEQVRTL
jgi:hypothetical protein